MVDSESFNSTLVEQFFEKSYPKFSEDLKAAFSCDQTNCKEGFARWIQASHWYCNTRWAFRKALLKDNIGPIYPTQFNEPNCDPVDGKNTKSCHCSEGAYVRGQRFSAFGQRMKSTFAKFYKTGSMDLKTFSEMNFDAFNILSASTWTQSPVLDWTECQILDKIQENADNRGYTFGY